MALCLWGTRASVRGSYTVSVLMSDSLPAFIVMSDGGVSGRNSKSFSSGYLPAIYQGTLMRTEGSPIMNLTRPFVDRLLRAAPDAGSDSGLESAIRCRRAKTTTRLAAHIANYELAFRMQMAGPELIDHRQRTGEHSHSCTGLEDEVSDKFGKMCLLARRMVERGVRFVQLISTDWDGHVECDRNHQENSRKIDRPVAALLTDLKQRGLLNSTLIVIAGEFGRTPIMQGTRGRDHHPYGFSVCMAGGGRYRRKGHWRDR